MIKKIKSHLKDADKTYFQHQKFALKISWRCLCSSFTAFVHAICPAFFEYTTSSAIKNMHNDLEPIYSMLKGKSNTQN
tara:strand:- start:45 stop:278 length:234 start_codon:yes stop_codon:yes gene_type:complete